MNCQVIVLEGESLLTSSNLACGDLAALHEQNVPQNVNKMWAILLLSGQRLGNPVRTHLEKHIFPAAPSSYEHTHGCD